MYFILGVVHQYNISQPHTTSTQHYQQHTTTSTSTMSPLTLLTLALGLLLAALPDSILAASNANIKYSGNSKLPLDPCDPYAGPWDKRNSAAVSQNLSNNESGCEKCIQVWYYDKSVTVNVRLRKPQPLGEKEELFDKKSFWVELLI